MMIREAPSLVCPSCLGTDLAKYGRTKAGLQKYRCRRELCGRQFVAGSTHLLDPKVKTMVMNLIAAGLSTKYISTAVPGLSRRWIRELKRRKREA
jgi:transposase-like protein